MQIKLSVSVGTKTVELQLDQANDTHKLAIINGVFGMFGQIIRHVGAKPVPEQTEPASSETGEKLGRASEDALREKQKLEIAKAKEEIQFPMPTERRRILPLLNSERTLSSSIGEHMENKPWIESGVKEKNGIPHYRCRYWCQVCKHQGSQYILPDDTTTECHACKTLHKVRPATSSRDSAIGLPNRDRFGNFFRADELAQIEDDSDA